MIMMTMIMRTMIATTETKKTMKKKGCIKKNKTLVLHPVWVFEGPQGCVYLLSRCTMETPLFWRHMINIYTFISLYLYK